VVHVVGALEVPQQLSPEMRRRTRSRCSSPSESCQHCHGCDLRAVEGLDARARAHEPPHRRAEQPRRSDQPEGRAVARPRSASASTVTRRRQRARNPPKRPCRFLAAQPRTKASRARVPRAYGGRRPGRWRLLVTISSPSSSPVANTTVPRGAGRATRSTRATSRRLVSASRDSICGSCHAVNSRSRSATARS
jgi:hypothetical protein